MWKFAICFLLATSAVSACQEKPDSIEPNVASRNLIKKIDPTIPPLAKMARVGGTVVLEIIIDPSGSVSSVNLVSGHPMLAPAFIAAVKQWRYSPFMKDGHPIAVTTRVEWAVTSPKYSQAQEKALQDYYPAFRSCYDLVQHGNAGDAEPKCRETVALSDQLPDNRVLERSDASEFLAHALYLQHKFADSIPFYEKAVEIRKPYEHSDSDADFASENRGLARAYAAVGNLAQSDEYYAQAITIFKAAIVSLPAMKSNYTGRLKDTLAEYAKVKEALGQNDEAARLKREAEQL